MTVQLSENISNGLANRVWELWKKDGIKSRFMTWLEVKKLADHFLKICRDQQRDYREYDFYTLIDSNLYFVENRQEIENQIGGLNSEVEKVAVNKLKDYLTEEELKSYTDNERSILEETEEKNKFLEKKVKKMSDQEKTTTEIKEGLEKVKNMTDAIMARLESLPNLEKQIEALRETTTFKDLGDALSPVTIALKPEETRPLSKQVETIGVNQRKEEKKSLGETILGFLPGGNNEQPPPQPETPDNPLVCKYCGGKLKLNWVKCPNCGAPIKTKALSLPAWIKPHHIHTLDLFAGIITFIIWVAATGWIIQTFGLSWGLVMGLAMFWLFFIVVFRLMIGGILD